MARDRSAGWRHAKIDGHLNEYQFVDQMALDGQLLSNLERFMFNEISKHAPKIVVDGNKKIDSIFEDKTTSKTDAKVVWHDERSINLSIKKSNSGQVWLVSVPRFIATLEFHMSKKLDSNIVSGISLFIGGKNIQGYEDLFKTALSEDMANSPKVAIQEKYQHRLVASSIEANYPDIWSAMVDFFTAHIGLITHLSFAQGLAIEKSEIAKFIIYNRTSKGIDFFYIPEIVKKAKARVQHEPIKAGPRNGGSTMLLPTGFLQMHHPKGENLLQFHHKYEKISKL